MESEDADKPDRGVPQAGARPEYEVAYYTKELGRSIQRKMLQSQLAGLKDKGDAAATAEGDKEPSPERPGDTSAQQDRPG